MLLLKGRSGLRDMKSYHHSALHLPVMAQLNGALYCDNIGDTANGLQCCYLNDRLSPVCQRNFLANNNTFSRGCPSGNCITDCQNIGILYSSENQNDPYEGNGRAPIQRYRTCANVPAMVGYSSQPFLTSALPTSINTYVPADTSQDDLKKVTAAITECLTQTCRASRNKTACESNCSPVNMLTNNTTPNLLGVNQCLNTLCTGGYNSLPFADADVIGIGVRFLSAP